MIKMKLAILLLSLISFIQVLYSDNYHIKDIELLNLPVNTTINQIYQDSEDRIWIAHNEGLIRYDGISEVVYSSDNHNLSDNDAKCIIERKGYIWVGTARGLNRINIQNGEVKSYYVDYEQQKSLLNDHINFLYKEERGSLYIGTNEGLYIYQDQNDNFTRLLTEYDETLNVGQKMLYTMTKYKNTIYIGTDDGLITYHLSSKILKSAEHEFHFLKNLQIHKLIKSGNQLIIATNQEIYQFSLDNNDYKLLSSNDYNNISQNKDDIIFINYGDHIIKYHAETGQKNKITLSNQFQNISFFMTDHQHTHWMMTENGMKLVKEETNELFNISDSNGKRINGQINQINAIDHVLYYVKNNKLFSYDLQNHQNKPITLAYQNLQNIKDMKTDQKAHIWLSTNHCIYETDIINNKHRLLFSDDTQEIGKLFFKEGYLIFQYGEGIGIYNDQNHHIKKYMINSQLTENSHFEVSCFTMQQKIIWIGTKNGLYKLDTQTGIIKRYHTDNSTLKHNSISALYTDKHNNLWIGTSNGLLHLYLHKSDHFSVYKLNFWITGITEDQYHNLWISGNKGLIRFRKEEGLLKRFISHNKTVKDDFSMDALIIEKDQLYAGSSDGIVSMNIQFDSKSQIKPVLSSFKIFNKDYFSHDFIKRDQDIRLSYKENFVSFRFTGLDYFHQGKLTYAYFLKNADHDWVYSGERNAISYSNLKGGEYTLYIKVCDVNGNWSDETKCLQFRIIPPFWSTLPFKAFVIITLILLASFVYYLRISSIQKNQKHLENIVNIRTKELSEAFQEIHIQKKDLEYSYQKLSETQNEIIELEKKNSVLAMAITANHEINQPLMVIKGNIEMLEIQLASIESKHQKYLNRIHQSVERISDILERFKNINKVKVKDYAENNDMIDLEEICS